VLGILYAGSFDQEANQSTQSSNQCVCKIWNQAHDLKGCKLAIFFHANPAGFF